jgi:hypothetical protein
VEEFWDDRLERLKQAAEAEERRREHHGPAGT